MTESICIYCRKPLRQNFLSLMFHRCKLGTMTNPNFYRRSMSYMEGYPKWRIWLGMPRAYIKIKLLSRHDR